MRQLVLHDDLTAPDGFDEDVPDDATLLVATSVDPLDTEPLGVAVLSGAGPVLTLDHLWVRDDRRGQGLGRMVLELLRARAVAQGAVVLTADVPAAVPAAAALARGSKVLGDYMTRPADARAVLPAGFGWRKMTADEFVPWHEAQVHAYAHDNLARSGGDAARALARSRADFATALPAGLDSADTALVVLEVEGERVGHLWLRHHRVGRETFGYDLEVVPRRRREGWGRAAIVLAGVLAAEAGDTVLGLHVFGDNGGARALYADVGFEVQSTKHDLLSVVPQTTSEDWIE